MELRSSNHFHYINEIKGGKVTKVPNVFRGKPALKFKNLQDVYGDLRNAPNSPARRRPKPNLKELPEKPDPDGREVKVENLQRFEGSGSDIERGSGVSSNSNSREAAEEHKNDVDIDFCCLTLNQLRVRCIAKKRKRFSKESSTGNSLSGAEEDDCDLMECLSSWRARIAQKRKVNQKKKKMSDLCRSKPALAITKFEDVQSSGEYPCQSDSSLASDVHVKDEVSESGHGDCQTMVLSDWVEPLVSFGLTSDDEDPSLSSGSDYEIPETRHADCQAIAVVHLFDSSNGLVEPLASLQLVSDREPGSSFGCDVEMGLSIESPTELLFLENYDSEESEAAKTSNDISNELQCCSVETDPQWDELEDGLQNCHASKMSYEHLEDLEASPPSSRCASSEESDTDKDHDVAVVAIDGLKDSGAEAMVKDEEEEETKAVLQQLSDVSLSQLEKDDMAIDSHLSGELNKVVSPVKDPCSIVHEDSKDGLQNNRTAASNIEITTKANTVWMVVDSCRFEGEAKDESSHLETTVDNCTNAISDDQVQILHPFPSAGDSSANLAMRSPSFPSADMERSSSDQPVKLVGGEDSDASDHQRHPPERLLSARKAISPTSQEKLRKAMESNELDDEQLYKFARKLCYGKKQPERKNSRPDGVNQAKRAAENTVSPQQLMRKLKNPKPITPPNDAPKAISRPVRAPSFSTGCTSIQSCSESAISFSQNQMRDFESMATKLTKELRSMKEIAEATLHGNPSDSPKYTHQEASSAIEKAARVEDNARRWLSTMARDCDRFCKLMKLAQNGSAPPAANVVVVQKEKRKKISFADEAGGQLCHVKTFKSEVEFMDPIHIVD
ncbi:unnamed protein product [Linum trigynum]|uniref:Uncharacterized protein n=1 Tax=Linum trigynum TaxID=586398 RepID=A0AAV2EE82_9ROSI